MLEQAMILLRTTRPAFLVLTPVCIYLGFGAAISAGAHPDNGLLWAVLVAALSAHISVNTLNEYEDFRSGLDSRTRKTAFSGGSGALPAQPEMAGKVLLLGIMSLLLTISIGLFVASLRELLLPIGLAGVLLIITYTRWLNLFPLLCLVAPGLGFGLLMVPGTYLIVAGELAGFPWYSALVTFFVLNNLLLLNQYPDMEADAGAGRRTFPIVYGVRGSNLVYGFFVLAASSLIVAGTVNGQFPGLAYISLMPQTGALFALYGAIQWGEAIGSRPQYLAANVAAAITTPLLLATAILYGG
ncbi:MAG: prenyltransferase [Gammaproteobacteria bacterium]|nr:prenyltransferase [Gammaproteobacteria bacterium]